MNALNQYTRAGQATFTHDPNGNLASEAAPDGTINYVYEIENRLIQASGAMSAALRYDPLGRLYQTGSTMFLYDGDALVAEYTETGALAERYVHGSAEGVDDPLLWFDNGVKRWLHADHQGSIVAVTDDGGAMHAINSYDEYGVPKLVNGVPANVGRFQYTGQAWIPELGMYHYKARIYSPTLGRFLQTDPVGYEDQMNLYAYVGNDPVTMLDPSGEFTVFPVAPNSQGKVVITSSYGPRSTGIKGASTIHNGTDFRAAKGTPIRATEDGTVVGTGDTPKGGNTVMIQNADGSRSGHAHTGAADGIKPGTEVKEGQQIGVSDGSGTGNAPHQHYTYRPGTPDAPATSSTKPVDPMKTQFKGMEGDTCVKGKGCP